MVARRCLVTGAGRGIGAAVARRLAAQGHAVALTARSAGELDAVAAGLPGPALVVPADLTDPIAADAVVGAVERAWGGPVEVLVLNAGAGTSAPLARTTDEDWARMLDLNLTAPFRLLRRALPGMVEGGWGRVVAVASTAAKRGDPYVAAYTASKHGLLGLVRSAAAEVAGSGVTVNAVCPGYVDTPMTAATVATISTATGRTPEQARETLARRQPIGRLVDPDEVADAVLLCVGSAAITGQGINVDGGTVQS
ncbi:SDR family NAD(P)-dependent oxidoreductase [Geodermatophilus sabuli]|uniref:Short-chain dehydrogenase n=1 Tax=Geodermatophilus sabuli TaxID=1564158 RepID=A0A285EJD7_9ACTN|nr:SDR family NAD(P)-dependent oxidoreductase [Geodermatophilus sabuli]MBB3083699.1 NAD(P)-dependent dehydrogenase (short-subunit alcohol dehydrogenase family) [Geodermatophilus sabuli]SNX99130.1 Short-chain dehydrogenase [Geodermatophilus sabuli]